jgi:hypothetical protein
MSLLAASDSGLEKQKLDVVVSLRGGVFRPYAGVSTAILVSIKTNSGGTDSVWFYDLEADGWSLDWPTFSTSFVLLLRPGRSSPNRHSSAASVPEKRGVGVRRGQSGSGRRIAPGFPGQGALAGVGAAAMMTAVSPRETRC